MFGAETLPGTGGPLATVLVLALGGLLLLAGRRLFWLAVALLGFGVAFGVTEAVAADLGTPWVWILAVAAGVLGSVLAVTLQRVAVVVGGFLLGLLGADRTLSWLGGPVDGGAELVVLVAGGIVVAVLATSLFALALRLVTAGTGAALVVFALQPVPPVDLLLFGGLWMAGFFLQGRRREREPGRRRPRR